MRPASYLLISPLNSRPRGILRAGQLYFRLVSLLQCRPENLVTVQALSQPVNPLRSHRRHLVGNRQLSLLASPQNNRRVVLRNIQLVSLASNPVVNRHCNLVLYQHVNRQGNRQRSRPGNPRHGHQVDHHGNQADSLVTSHLENQLQTLPVAQPCSPVPSLQGILRANQA